MIISWIQRMVFPNRWFLYERKLSNRADSQMNQQLLNLPISHDILWWANHLNIWENNIFLENTVQKNNYKGSVQRIGVTSRLIEPVYSTSRLDDVGANVRYSSRHDPILHHHCKRVVSFSLSSMTNRRLMWTYS